MKISWDSIDRAEWDRRIAAGAELGAPPLQQEWSYGEAMRMLGGAALRAVVDIDGEPKALAQFTLRRIGFGRTVFASWALCARGPLWLNGPSEEEKAAIYEGLRRNAPLGRRRAVFFSPDEAAPSAGLIEAGLRRVMTGYSTAIVDLRDEAETLRARMQGKWRNRLVAAEKEELEIVSSRPKPGRYDWLLKKDEEQQHRKGYQALPGKFVAAYQHAADCDDRQRALRSARQRSGPAWERRSLRLLRADKAGRPVAAMLFLVHGRAATYHIGWSGDQGRKLGAHNALLWRAMRDFRSEGFAQLDLGGVDTERGAGIARFKLGCGAKPLTLCGTYL